MKLKFKKDKKRPEITEQELRMSREIEMPDLDSILAEHIEEKPSEKWFSVALKFELPSNKNKNFMLNDELGLLIRFSREDAALLERKPISLFFKIDTMNEHGGTLSTCFTEGSSETHAEFETLNPKLLPFLSFCVENEVHLGAKCSFKDSRKAYGADEICCITFSDSRYIAPGSDNDAAGIYLRSMSPVHIACGLLHCLEPERALRLKSNQLPVYGNKDEIRFQEFAYRCRYDKDEAVINWLAANKSQIKFAENTDVRSKLIAARRNVLDINWNCTLDASRLPTLEEAKEILDSYVYGMDEVKKRIINILAKVRLTGQYGKPVLLAGPPGVGKTAISQAVAEIFNLDMLKIFCSKVRDPEEMFGSSILYSNSAAGRLFRDIHRFGKNNYLLFLDDMDQLFQLEGGRFGNIGQSFRGLIDGSGLDETFLNLLIATDSKHIQVIATVNDVDCIAQADRSRYNVIELPAYTKKEKTEIFTRYIIPKLLAETGFERDAMAVDEEAAEIICSRYSAEPGVRKLESIAEKLLEDYCVLLHEKGKHKKSYHADELEAIIGRPEIIRKTKISAPGVVCSLLYSKGRIKTVLVEAAVKKGSGRFSVLNVPDDFYKDCCKMAYELLKGSCDMSAMDVTLCIPDDNLPAMSVNSIGLAAYAAMLSALENKAIASRTAFFGGCDILGNSYLDLTSVEITGAVNYAGENGFTTLLLPGMGSKLISGNEIPDMNLLSSPSAPALVYMAPKE